MGFSENLPPGNESEDSTCIFSLSKLALAYLSRAAASASSIRSDLDIADGIVIVLSFDEIGRRDLRIQ